ncbi:MAG TPA: glycosyltransferase family 39 protein [Chloroflexota bacterium]|nr:glycosyltransferase family 39 protein [Chloroflexota bacterium]
MNPRLARPALTLIVLVYLALASLYAVRVPIWNAPDEPAHYNFVRSIAIDHRLPILEPGAYDQARLGQLTSTHFPADQSVLGISYESHQPPLYYLIAAPVLLARPGADPRTQGVALRFVTVIIGALVVLASYRLGRRIFPKSYGVPLAAAAFVAFVPQHLFMDAAIDNDALAELLVCLTLIVLVEDLWEGGNPVNDWRAGLLVGLCILTKLVAAVSAPLVVLGFVGSATLAKDPAAARRRLPLRLVRAGAAAAVLSGWWLIRNLLIYGVKDPFGLRRHAEVVVGQPLTGKVSAKLIADMSLTAFHSFWGQFGWMGIPFADRTYDVLASFCVVVTLGVALFAARLVREVRQPGEPRSITAGPTALPLVAPQYWALGLLLAETAFVLVGVVFYNLRYLQPQGRYLFPALPALAIFAVLGIGELIRERYLGLVLFLTGAGLGWLCIFSLFSVIGPALGN